MFRLSQNQNYIIMGLVQGKNETTHIKQAYPEIKEPCFVAFRKNLFDKIVVVDQIVNFFFFNFCPIYLKSQ